MKETILAVDDDKDILNLIKYNLEKSGYKTLTAVSGGEAIDIAIKKTPALIILDLMLPGVDGIEVCSILRKNEKTRDIPVIMLTARSSEEDMIKGLSTGADDYITKPFSPKVLLARIETVLRRKKEAESGSREEGLSFGIMKINPEKHEVTVDLKPVLLTKTEFNILLFLSLSGGKVFSREQILDNAWTYETVVIDRAVDVHVKSLRTKLGKAGKFIQTVRGVGYKFDQKQ
ncbi:MAG: response regulator [Candidatus Firestonebacteria bacterium]